MSAMMKLNPFRKTNGGEEWGPLARWNPLREMEQFENRMERIFRNWPTWTETREPLAVVDWVPQVDIAEDDKEYLIKAELPEVKKEDVKVRLEDGVLCITGERKSEKEEKGRKFHRIERNFGSFERNFTLPEDAESAKISSEFRDGMLQIHLPKNPTAKTKAIEVKIQ